MKRLIIDDIHGCYAELLALLDKASLSADDEIIALGDIVDRGPDSPRVLDFFRHRPRAHAIMGNHERKHVRSFRGEIPPARSQVITRLQLGDAYPEAVAYMQAMPRYLDLPEATLVHGFLEPNVPLGEQRETVVVGTLSGEAYLKAHYARPWYELYQGDKPVIVGHRDYLGSGEAFIYRERVFCIDTGCCTGGRLTGLLLPAFRLVSVPSRANYWQQMQEWYYRQVLASTSAIWEKVAKRALERILEHVMEEHKKVLTHLRAESSFDELSPHEQGKIYAAYIGATPLAGYLHLARRGELTPERLRGHFKQPEKAVAFARKLGLLADDDSA